ncbi:MAG: hypothetical protein EA398_16005 [Deltaproteobacteria bacterium]|nr:MAG: hypothetical protein EA398_16005 [Deltaproteobacteria bacterium]
MTSKHLPFLAAALVLGALTLGACDSTTEPNLRFEDNCSGVVCDPGDVCDPERGRCVSGASFCEDVRCGFGQTCSPTRAQCVGNPFPGRNPCDTLECDGETPLCYHHEGAPNGRCVAADFENFCSGVRCGLDQTCRAGVCVARSGEDATCGDNCRPWETCIAGTCISQRCSGDGQGSCPTNMRCLLGECVAEGCTTHIDCNFAWRGVCSGGTCEVPTCTSDAQCRPGGGGGTPPSEPGFSDFEETFPDDGFETDFPDESFGFSDFSGFDDFKDNHDPLLSCVRGRCRVAECGAPGADGCGDGQFCDRGACANATCDTNDDCDSGRVCRLRECVAAPRPGRCRVAQDCGTGACVDGYCLDDL